MKRQQTMLSFLSRNNSNKKSRRVAGKPWNNFREKQNKAYFLAVKKKPRGQGRSRNVLGGGAPRNCVIDWWTDRNTSYIIKPQVISRVGGGGGGACLYREILLEMHSRQPFKKSLKIKAFSSVKVLNVRRLGSSYWWDFVDYRHVVQESCRRPRLESGRPKV